MEVEADLLVAEASPAPETVDPEKKHRKKATDVPAVW